jgi:hypothetical protein
MGIARRREKRFPDRLPLFLFIGTADTGIGTMRSSFVDETEPPALTPELIQQTIEALSTAAEEIDLAHLARDEARILRWMAHGARAALRLAEAGYADLNVMTVARSRDQPDLNREIPISSQYRGRPAGWSGFRYAALVLIRCAAQWYPDKFPPSVGNSDDVQPDNVRIAYRVLADRIANGNLPGSDAGDHGSKDNGKQSRRRRRKGNRKTRPLTAKESEAVHIVGEHKGNITKAAEEIGVSRQALTKRFKAAHKKLGTKAMPKPKTKPMPTDRRGQETTSEADDRRR